MAEPAIAEEFSEGYYISRFYLRPDQGKPTINVEDFYDLQYDIYDAGEHKDEVMLKIGNTYFEVSPRTRTPARTLELPPEMMTDMGIENPPVFATVYVVKPWVTDYLTFRGGS